MITGRQIERTFKSGDAELTVFRNLDIDVADGEFVAIMGESGAGKSTLLHLLGLVDRPTSGDIYFNGLLTGDLPEHKRDEIRLRHIGFLLQQHHLLLDFTALENVALPMIAAGIPRSEAKERAMELLSNLGLGGRLAHFPSQLSGGEMQRTALCRALINSPDLLIADEPTGNLDQKNSEKLMEYLLQERERRGLTILLATHDPEISAHADRVLRIADGRLADG